MQRIGQKFLTAVPPTLFQEEAKLQKLTSSKTHFNETKKMRVLNEMHRVRNGDGLSTLKSYENAVQAGLGVEGEQNADPVSTQAMMNALSIELHQLTNAQEDEKIDQAFIDGFVDWIQGKVADCVPDWKRKQIQDRTWWWWVKERRRGAHKDIRGKDGPFGPIPAGYVLDKVPLHGEDFVAYLRHIIGEKYEFMRRFEVLKNFVPGNLKSAWLYWKYVINGNPSLESDFISVFSDDWSKGFPPEITNENPPLPGPPTPGAIPSPKPSLLPGAPSGPPPFSGNPTDEPMDTGTPDPGSDAQRSVSQALDNPTADVTNTPNQPQQPLLPAPPQAPVTPAPSPAPPGVTPADPMQEALNETTRLRGEISRLETELKTGQNASSQADKLRSELGSAKEGLKKAEESARKEARDAKKREAMLKAESQKQLESLSGKIKEHETSLQRIQGEKFGALQKLGGVESELDKARIEILRLNSTIQGAGPEFDKARAALMASQENEANLVAELHRLQREREVSGITGQREEQRLAREISRLNSEMGALSQQAKDRESTLRREFDALSEHGRRIINEKTAVEESLRLKLEEEGIQVNQMRALTQSLQATVMELENTFSSEEREVEARVNNLVDVLRKDLEYTQKTGQIQFDVDQVWGQIQEAGYLRASLSKLREGRRARKKGGEEQLAAVEENLKNLTEGSLLQKLRAFSKSNDPLLKQIAEREKQVKDLEKSYFAKLQSLQKEFESTHTNEIEDLKQRHHQAMDKMQKELRAETERMGTEMANKSSVQRELEIKNMEVLMGGINKHLATIDELEGQIEELKKENHYIHAKLKGAVNFPPHPPPLQQLGTHAQNLRHAQSEVDQINAEMDFAPGLQGSEEEKNAALQKAGISRAALVRFEEEEKHLVQVAKNARSFPDSDLGTVQDGIEAVAEGTPIHRKFIFQMDTNLIGDELGNAGALMTEDPRPPLQKLHDLMNYAAKLKEEGLVQEQPAPFVSAAEAEQWRRSRMAAFEVFFQRHPEFERWKRTVSRQLLAETFFSQAALQYPTGDYPPLTQASKGLIATHLEEVDYHAKSMGMQSGTYVRDVLTPMLEVAQKGGLSYSAILAYLKDQIHLKTLESLSNTDSQVSFLSK